MRRVPLLILSFLVACLLPASAAGDALSGTRHRVLVSTDIGGTDPDDFQSMVHLLLYADLFDLEGLVSSPYGPGRKEHILEVIDAYEIDYPRLKARSADYPSPDALRAISKQGALESFGFRGTGDATEGSAWIIDRARHEDPRPLHLLVWGGIEDLAQALRDAPDILPKLRVHFIGGPNKMWSIDAYHYVESHHPELWIIESNSTYRGWFNGGPRDGEWSNRGFVERHIAGRGALGKFFAQQLEGTIKMGDTPTVSWLMRGDPADPSQPGWGGQFVRIWEGRTTVFDRLTTAADQVEAFGTVEFALPIPPGFGPEISARMLFDNRIPAVAEISQGSLRFRFSPRDAKEWPYVIQSDLPALDGKTGSFTAVAATPERVDRPSSRRPHWWIDSPDPALAEGHHAGAATISRWREDFLRDFAQRMETLSADSEE